MEITVLIDNRTGTSLCPEFGLSFLIRSGKEEYLFDTGSGGVLKSNLLQLGIDPKSIRNVILSHGHYDHTGGLRFLSPHQIFCCPGILAGHYSRHDSGEIHKITMPEDAQKIFHSAEIRWITEFQPISEELFLTGPIPRISREDCGGDFYHDESCTEPDIVPEEQALLSRNGVLVSGCCHAGIRNTILYCQKKHPEIKIRKVIGGLHLRHASPERLQKTADFFRENGIDELFLLHCTGETAIEYLRSALPGCIIHTPQPGMHFRV